MNWTIFWIESWVKQYWIKYWMNHFLAKFKHWIESDWVSPTTTINEQTGLVCLKKTWSLEEANFNTTRARKIPHDCLITSIFEVQIVFELILPTSNVIVQQHPRSYRFVIDSSTAVQLLYVGICVELDKSLLLKE